MERSWYGRLVLVLLLIGLAIFLVAPSLIYFQAPPDCRRSKECLKGLISSFWPEKRINLGIDLQGGLHLVMGVDAEKAAQNRTDRVADEIVASMEDKGLKLNKAMRTGDVPEIEIELVKEDDFATLKEILDFRQGSFEVRQHNGTRVVYGMTSEHEKQLKEDAVSQAIKTLRNRIDKYGVSEPEVRKRGADSIMIQIAGLTADEEESVKDEIIGKTAQLEFKKVDDESKYFAEIAEKGLPEGVELDHDQFRGPEDSVISSPYLRAKDKDLLVAFVKEHPPAVDRVVTYQRFDNKDKTVTWRTWLVDRRTPLTGDALVSAFVSFNSEENMYEVSMKLDRAGAKIFADFTEQNIHKRMAIVLDDVVDSAPVIQSKIPEGNVRITLGGGTRTQNEILEDAKKLAIVLNAGALPAPVFPQEQRTVGATLGDDAVNLGRKAIIAATILMVLMMVAYYRWSGVIATLALGCNILFLCAALASVGATMTLPGLAGLVLTVGMVVDANIIQFERIRDELTIGKTARAAVDAGFSKAFTAIFDANVTTLIACAVLFQYGSGPIRGFATTLGLGVIINTFTAVVVPRLCFDYLVRGRRAQTLSI